MDLQFENLLSIIQLAIAPAFLLAAAGMHLRVLTNRLTRIVDRENWLAEQADEGTPERAAEYAEERVVLWRRHRVIHRSIAWCGACALLVCLVIVTLFIGDMPGVGGTLDAALNTAIALLFIAGMLCLVASYLYFLDEIFLSIRKIRLTIRGSRHLRR